MFPPLRMHNKYMSSEQKRSVFKATSEEREMHGVRKVPHFVLFAVYLFNRRIALQMIDVHPTDLYPTTQINMLMTFIHHPAPYCFFADSPYGYLRWGFIGMKSNANQMYSTQQTHCVSIDCGMQIFRSNSTRGQTILYTKESKSVSISCSLRNTEYR